VLGYPAGEATRVLERAGVAVGEVVATAPPGADAGRGEPRVIRQRVRSDGSVELTVAFGEYEEARGE